MNIKTDPTEFAGKRVLVSGGTKGLGRATVERFLAGGARVVTAARSIKDSIEGVEYVQADLTTAEGGEAWPRRHSSGWAASTFSPMSSVARLRRRVASPR
jgi:NAD(P)-dependent dehydrogenase (short-subunit alcohol dehydrogenase family)